METEPKYKRILLKISGEALAGEQKTGLDFGVIGQVCDVIKACTELGVQVGVVIGAGSDSEIWCFQRKSAGIMENTEM